MSNLDLTELSIEEQTKVLRDALTRVKQHAFYMKKSLNTDRYIEGMKHAHEMVTELCVSSLMPKAYYELYMLVFDNLRFLANLLGDAHTSKKINLVQLYELVQYSAKIVPRLYMMITVGSVYMTLKETPMTLIMRDLIDMCRGVQHPIRGLFLRYYLSIMTKDELIDLPIPSSSSASSIQPDPSMLSSYTNETHFNLTSSSSSSSSSLPFPNENEASSISMTVMDSIQFILENFIEMNKLWVRLQHQGYLKDQEKRESERKELRILIGSNLVRLSQLESVDFHLYQRVIFPSITQQILQCKDVLAQEYLMEVLIQVFPDAFHLQTVKEVLTITAQLQPLVNVNYIISGLIDRIRKYQLSNHETELDSTLITSTQLFDYLWSESKQLMETRHSMALPEMASLFLSMIQLAVTCYPEHPHYTEDILVYAKQKWDAASSQALTLSQTITQYHTILSTVLFPLKEENDLLYLFRLPHCFQSFRDLLLVQPYTTRHHIAVHLVEALVKSKLSISTEVLMVGLLDCLQVFIKDQKDGPLWKSSSALLEFSEGQEETRKDQLEAIAKEQCLVDKFLLLIYHDDPDVHAQLLVTVRKYLAEGGGLRMKHTYPPLVYQLIHIVQRIRSLHPIDASAPIDSPEQIATSRTLMTHFKFIHQLIQSIQLKSDEVKLALELYLIAARAADKVQLEAIGYEFFVSAFTIYEESINDSKKQFITLTHLVNSLLECTSFQHENYLTLSLKCTVHAARMLKRQDQCRAMLFCSHLFWHSVPTYRDPQRVLECLQRSIKFADACLDTLLNMELLIEILVRYLYFYQHRCSTVQVKSINDLLELITTLQDHVHSEEEFSNLHQGFSSLSLTETVRKRSGMSQYDVVMQYFQRICKLILKRKQTNSELSTLYREIRVPSN